MRTAKSILPLLFLAACADSEVGIEATDLVGQDDPGDHFAKAMVSADFDGDGVDDLAVGTPFEHNAAGTEVGAVYLYRGTSTGLVPWHTLVGTDASGRFGVSLAAKDLDGDGKAELVVGVPGANSDTGKAMVFGGASWPWTSKTLTLPSGATGDGFGTTVAVGAFIADQTLGGIHRHSSQVIVGAPAISRIAAFFVTAHTGSDTFANESFGFDSSVSLGTSSGHFGTALAVGNMSGGSYDNLAIGTPGVDRVYILDGADAGVMHGGSTVIGGSVASFGSELAYGRFDSTGRAQLLIGAPDDGAGSVALTSYTKVSNSYPIVHTFFAQDFGITISTAQFGAAIAAGRVDGSSVDHVVVGAPFAASEAGRVGLYFVSGGGFSSGNLFADRDGLDGNAHFGTALAIGRFNATTGPRDIAIGQPNRSSGAGALWILHGHNTGPTYLPATLTTFLQQSSN